MTRSGLDGITLEVFGPLIGGSEPRSITSPLIGEFNAENLLLALGVLIAWDVPIAEACDLLAGCAPLPGRMELVRGDEGRPQVVVDYAHTPAGLERVLHLLRLFAAPETGEARCTVFRLPKELCALVEAQGVDDLFTYVGVGVVHFRFHEIILADQFSGSLRGV